MNDKDNEIKEHLNWYRKSNFKNFILKKILQNPISYFVKSKEYLFFSTAFDKERKKLIKQNLKNSVFFPELYYKYVKSQLKDDMVTEANLPIVVKAMIEYENTKEVADYYLSDPKILQEAFALSTMSFDKGTSYEEAKEIYRQEPLHLSQHVPEHLKY